VPSVKELGQIKNNTASLIYAQDGPIVGKIFAVNRSILKYEDLPPTLVEALVATEDARFFEHKGVDYRSLGRVLVKTLILQNRSAGGGSTLTQQLAKNLFGRKDFAFLSLPVSKTKEIILAQRLENIYSKEEIIELYLNTVSFSENTYGLKTGALRFFNKAPHQLKLEESAVLVGLLKANTYYNPRLNPNNARLRRNVVLSQMAKNDYLSKDQADSLQQLPLQINYTNLSDNQTAGYFNTQVKKELTQILEELVKPNGGAYDPKLDGLRIYTTLNSEIQAAAENALNKHMAKLQKLFNRHWRGSTPWHANPQVFQSRLESSRSYKALKARGLKGAELEAALNQAHPVELYHPLGGTVITQSIKDSVAYYLNLLMAGTVALNPQNGAVKAWVGGRSFRWMPYDHVLAKRQAASTFKPIVFAAALENGADPCDYVEAQQRRYPSFDNWAPRNYDNNYEGLYSMAGALKKSINTVTVKTLMKTGVDENLALAKKMGIESSLPRNPTLALGTGSVTLLEMTVAYANFANGGKRVTPHFITKIKDAAGKTIYQREADEPQQSIDPQNAQLMTAMLQGVVNDGTGRALKTHYGLPNQLAGKTGTAQNYTDGWFIGYNPKLVMGVWVGGSSPVVRFKTGTYGSGSAMALPIFGLAWQHINKQPNLNAFTSAKFEALSPALQEQLACADYAEKQFFDQIKDLFKKKRGEKVYEKQENEEPKKPGFLKRLFGKKEEKKD
jgi:penicillin-binding protein 1A